METILIILTVGTLCSVCFFIGAKVGQTTAKGNDLNIKTPTEYLEERKDKKKAREEKDKYDIILENIERYDGTSKGQREVPR